MLPLARPFFCMSRVFKHSFMKEKICVTGLGHIGPPTALLLATKGCERGGVDIAEEVVDMINRAKVHLRESA